MSRVVFKIGFLGCLYSIRRRLASEPPIFSYSVAGNPGIAMRCFFLTIFIENL